MQELLQFENSMALFKHLFKIHQTKYGAASLELVLEPGTLISWGSYTALVVDEGWLYKGDFVAYDNYHLDEFLEKLPWVQ